MSEEKFPQITHSRIMRSVRVVKNRYYLYGLLSGFIFGFGLAGYVAYDKIIEQNSFEFVLVWLDAIKIDFSLYADFVDEFKEFLPLENLFILFILLSVVLVLGGIILSFRRALFTKVEKFPKDKINQNN